MKRREPTWEPLHRASARHRVAVEAARMLYHREVKEYFHAKREAARRQGTEHLPSNREVHEQLLLIARKVEGDEHEQRLERMRRQALSLMELLQAYQPRLIGSVLTGHIRHGSDVDLHLFSEELDPVLQTLEQAGYAPAVEVVRSRKYGEEMEFVHVRLTVPEGFEVEMTVYALDFLHTHPRCGITGGPMRRATLAEVRQLLREPLPSSAAWERVTIPLDVEALGRLIPELGACRGVLQNHYHHLDVFDHTVEVVRGLEAMVESGFARFGPRAPQLRRQVEVSLLLLAGLCHDLGKPGTQSFARDGRIRFLGHEHLGAEITRRVGGRLGWPTPLLDQLVRLVETHMEAVLMPEEPSRIHRLFQQAGSRLPELALLSLADVEAARGPAQTAYRLEEHQRFAHFLLDQYFEQGFLANPCLPISADDLAEELGVTEEKSQRRLLERLTAAFVDGEFEGREEGLSLAGDFLASPWERK